MISISSIVDRLSQQVPFARTVSVAAAANHASSHVTPALYVTPISESVDGNGRLRGASQLVTQRIGVLEICRYADDAHGEKSVEQIEPLRQQVIDALVDWAPDDQSVDPLVYRGGRMVSFEGGALWWLDEFETYWRLSR